MTDISFVKKKIGQRYLVWFQKSNLYVQLEEPAWFVFSKIIKRYKTDTISKEFSYRYSLGYKESVTFVEEIQHKIAKMNQTVTSVKKRKPLEYPNRYIFEPYSTRRYELGDKIIRFSFETSWLEDYIHPLINSLEISERSNNLNAPHFELFSYHNKLTFRLNGEIKGSWAEDESHFAKGKIFIELINVMHNKTDSDWLMTVHASAVTNGKKTILFSAPQGSGKTTLAALLQTKGFQLISDDFVPIDKQTFCAYPFPIAMSIKKGSLNILKQLLPELGQNPHSNICSDEVVRYIPIEMGLTNMILPVNDFIFIKYDKTVDFKLEKLDSVIGIKLLLEQTWVAPEYQNAEILFDKLSKSSFYKLNYSNNHKALDAIIKLFDYD